MKHNELTLGQIEAIANKLGGTNGVKLFLSGKTMVTWKTWKTVTHEDGSREDLVRVTPAELGFPKGATRGEIYAHGKDLGLEPCSNKAHKALWKLLPKTLDAQVVLLELLLDEKDWVTYEQIEEEEKDHAREVDSWRNSLDDSSDYPGYYVTVRESYEDEFRSNQNVIFAKARK